jgi:hypothetical protein
MSNALISPFLYEFDIGELAQARLVAYVMPLRAYEALKRAQGIETNKNADIRGIEPILAWAAPAVDCAFIDRIDKASPPRSLHFWMYAPQRDTELLKKELQAALTMWIGLVAPSGKEEILAALSDERSLKTAWREEKIDSALHEGRICATPRDARIFDLLTVHAARLLEGKVLSVQGSERGLLVPTGPRQNLYGGKKLLRADPHAVAKKSDDFPHHWTETFNITSLSTPEQRRLRIGVSVSIRNFVPIRRATFAKGRARYVDVFLTSPGLSTADQLRQHAISVPITRHDFDALREGSAPDGRASPSLAILQRLLSMHGQEQLKFSEDGRLTAITGDRMAIYPRGGSGHGDRFLPGATGIGAPDRKDYLDFLDTAFTEAGFSRVTLERRSPTRALSIKRFSDDKSEQNVSIQRAVIRALESLNNSRTLNIAMLVTRPQTVATFFDAVISLFGTPLNRTATEVCYSDEFKVKITPLAGGPFSTRLDDPETALLALPADLPTIKRKQVKRKAIEDAANQRLLDMEEHLKSLPDSKGISAAVIEMDERIVEEPARDPYNLAYKALAKRSIIGQVVLFDPDNDAFDALQNNNEHQLRSALRDILRSLGVSFAEETPTGDTAITLQGWWVINLNADRFDTRPGAAKAGAVIPVAVRYSNGLLEACATSTDHITNWRPYPNVLLDLELGKCKDLSELRPKDLAAAIGQFYASIAAEICEETVVLCDATNIRQYLSGLGNANLKFDELPLGEVGAATAVHTVIGNGPISIVRLCTDTAKSPSYWVSENKQGITTGMFAELSATRTLWISRGLPVPLQKDFKTQAANRQSRYLGNEQERPNLNDRRFPSLSELCVVVKGKNADPAWLATLTRRAMSVHATTDESTVLPFPLHEAHLLAKAAH